ncbi:MAG: ABC transporter ATP-binding protein, partial [Firmicutes bacterium]|nr:ABC transporter ATP-binding protein [Bacillota bacterium]
MSNERTSANSRPLQGGPAARGANAGLPKIDKQSLKSAARLFSYIRGRNRAFFIIALFCILGSCYVSVRSNTFLQTLIDDYITPLSSQANPDLAGLAKALAFMGGLYAFSIVITLGYNLLLATVSQSALKDIRDAMFSHMQLLPIRYFDNNAYGNIMSRYTNDTDSMRQMMSQSVPQMLSSFFSIILILIAMIRTSGKLTILVLCVIFVMLVITMSVGGASAKNFKLRQAALGDLNGYIEEMISGQKVIKVFCHEEKTKEVFDEKNTTLRKKNFQANAFANMLMPIMAQIGNVQYVLIAIVGGWLAITGRADLTLGQIAAFLLLSKNFNQPVSQISQQINAIVMALAGAQRVFDLIDEGEEMDTEGVVTLVNAKINEDGTIEESRKFTSHWAWKIPNEDGTFSYTEVKGDIRIQHLDFGYVPEKTVLHDISLFAHPGQKIAFVGSTGSGKTTITNTLNRFYYIPDGTITYDGIDINRIKKHDLRRSMGQVLQDTHLFTGTIRDNIRYGRLNATDFAVEEAGRLANADSFIRKLPDGYDTVISGTGSQLSQGQCQLISIAR